MRRITRVESDRERSWRVCVRRYGQSVTKAFTDLCYGGKRKSLAAAKIYRNALEAHIATFDADHRLWRRAQKTRGNSSGTVGVARYLAASKKQGGMPAPYWQAFWLDAWGKRQRKNFRVGVHGERKAKRLAREAYAQGLAEAHAALQRNALLEQQIPRLGKEHEPLLFAAAFAAESLRP
ncbi:hypothetical protein [Polaromonas sp. LjRoot131]|uniref:hypothetical protein n=1 Tax=Polaromonas sp. LjRoot131 TaxID=3342262 RepID=UPI003ECCB4F7